MDDKPERIRQLFDLLMAEPIVPFPVVGEPQCPTAKGVYVIYDRDGIVCHVGRTPSGLNGLRQRLNDHLQGRSSFVRKGLANQASSLRNGFGFRCLVVSDPEERALLEYLAIGTLCPKHLGLSNTGLVEF